MSSTAVVIGGGIGGLCAAIGLHRRGWHVQVLERAPRIEPVGSGIPVLANGLRALESLGVAGPVRAAGLPDMPGGARTPDGRWITRVDSDALVQILGTTAIAMHRATLHRILLEALPGGVVRTGAEVCSVRPDRPARVDYRQGDEVVSVRADLVVAADGINSAVRRQLWPHVPAPVYCGSTAWRGVTAKPWQGPLVAAVTLGRGAELGIVPLGDGRVYWYLARNAPPGGRSPGGDELGAVRAWTEGWHEPIPQLLARTDPAGVIRTDLHHLADPPGSYRLGPVVLLGDAAHAMTPHLGQGGNQAMEDAAVLAAVCDPAGDLDAALDEYDRLRRPRAQQVARASARSGRIGQQLANPALVALRNTAIRMLPAKVALRRMAGFADWQPPPRQQVTHDPPDRSA